MRFLIPMVALLMAAPAMAQSENSLCPFLERHLTERAKWAEELMRIEAEAPPHSVERSDEMLLGLLFIVSARTNYENLLSLTQEAACISPEAAEIQRQQIRRLELSTQMRLINVFQKMESPNR